MSIKVGQRITVTLPVTVHAGLTSGTVITNAASLTSPGMITPISGQTAITVDAVRVMYFPIIFRNYCFRPPDFFDDFSDPNSGWGEGDYSNVRFEYVNGEYRILSKKSGYIFFPKAPTYQRENFILESDMRWAGTPGTAYGLIFGKDGYEDGIYFNFVEYYLFDMNTALRQFRLLRCGSDSCRSIVPPTFNSAIRSGTASNHLKALRHNNRITLEANGTILGTWTDGTISGWMNIGIVSLPVSNPNADARYDNFSVASLPCSRAATRQYSRVATETGESRHRGAQRFPASADLDWAVPGEKGNPEAK